MKLLNDLSFAIIIANEWKTKKQSDNLQFDRKMWVLMLYLIQIFHISDMQICITPYQIKKQILMLVHPYHSCLSQGSVTLHSHLLHEHNVYLLLPLHTRAVSSFVFFLWIYCLSLFYFTRNQKGHFWIQSH